LSFEGIAAANKELWLESHRYLQPAAEFFGEIERAAANVFVTAMSVPAFDGYYADYQEGIPLLRSSHVCLDCSPAERALAHLIEDLNSRMPYRKLSEEIRELHAHFKAQPRAASIAITSLLRDEPLLSAHPGLLRFLGWTCLARSLCPVVHAFGKWRQEENWLRGYCPTCGAGPSMGQLVGLDPGRLRFLFCGCCATRWRFQRTACPFCEAGDDHKIAALVVEGEKSLRIDYCESCRAYIKMYLGEGNESLMLADWTSLHLDLLASHRGLVQRTASLYQL
jgi:FdhE protein